MLELIFSKFFFGDFIDYWLDIDFIEIEFILEIQLVVLNVLYEVIIEKGYIVIILEVNKVLDVILEKLEVFLVVEFLDYKNSNGNFLI